MTAAQQKAMSAIGEAAAEWVVRLNAPVVDAADKAAFMQWLRQSPVHVQEYLRAEVLFLAMQGAAKEDTSDVGKLMRETSPNVVGLPIDAPGAAAADGTSMQRRRRLRGRSQFVVGVIAATVAVAVGAWLAFPPAATDAGTYATGVGEQRQIVLADGSSVELNTRSRMRVNMTGHSREIFLAEGEAFFNVAKDANRPFRVTSGTAVVRAIGTQFNVRHSEGKTLVTVVEGRVAVIDLKSTSAAAEVTLAAGQGINVGVAASPATANLRAATAWRQRRLIFEDRALAEVVAEFNRYNRRQFEIADPALAQQRISGVFDADKPEDLIGFLLNNGAAQVDNPSGTRILLAPPR